MSDVPPASPLSSGPPTRASWAACSGWWQARFASQPLIVVPTAPDARGLSAEMAQAGRALVGQSPAITFDGLVRLLLGRSPRYAGDFERSLADLLSLAREPPQAPGFSARFPGTAAVAGSLLQQLGDSGRSPSRSLVCSPSGRPWIQDPRSGRRYPRLLSGYRPSRPAGVVRPVRCCPRGARSRRRWTRPLALYGFTSFTLAQRG